MKIKNLLFCVCILFFAICCKSTKETEYILVDSDIFKFHFYDKDKVFGQESNIVILRLAYEIYKCKLNSDLIIATSPYVIELNSLNIDVTKKFLSEHPRFFSATSEIQKNDVLEMRNLNDIFNSYENRTKIKAGDNIYYANKLFPYVVVVDSFNEKIYTLENIRIPPLFAVNKNLISIPNRGVTRLSVHENYGHTHQDPVMYALLKYKVEFILDQTANLLKDSIQKDLFGTSTETHAKSINLLRELPIGRPE